MNGANVTFGIGLIFITCTSKRLGLFCLAAHAIIICCALPHMLRFAHLATGFHCALHMLHLRFAFSQLGFAFSQLGTRFPHHISVTARKRGECAHGEKDLLAVEGLCG